MINHMVRLLSKSIIKKICGELLVPDQIVSNVCDIDLENLKKEGFFNLFLDLDNTLVSANQRHLSLKHINWIQKCKDFGFNVFLLSNNRSSKRVYRAAKQVDCYGIYMAMKPFTFSASQLAQDFDLDLKKTVMIGDQALKDVISGNWLKMHTILVDPIDDPLPLLPRAQKKFEDYWIEKLSLD